MRLLHNSGYFPYWENKPEATIDEIDSFGLRWHGIVEKHRNQGYSSQALAQVANVILQKHPEATFLIELMPVDDDAALRDEYFRRLGFHAHGPQEKFSWHNKPWQPYIANLIELAHLNEKPKYKI